MRNSRPRRSHDFARFSFRNFHWSWYTLQFSRSLYERINSPISGVTISSCVGLSAYSRPSAAGSLKSTSISSHLHAWSQCSFDHNAVISISLEPMRFISSRTIVSIFRNTRSPRVVNIYAPASSWRIKPAWRRYPVLRLSEPLGVDFNVLNGIWEMSFIEKIDTKNEFYYIKRILKLKMFSLYYKIKPWDDL